MGTLDARAHALPDPLRVIIGAGEQAWEGWVPTHREQLDLLDRGTWKAWFGDRRADALLCEHVFEHLTLAEGRAAARLCFEFLKPGGFLRCAVPDANLPDEDYQRAVRVGGPGPAADHKIVYEHRLFAAVFADAGFEVELLEYWDDTGGFHYRPWDPRTGPVYRSLLMDHRNKNGRIGFASLILDARRPSSSAPTGP